MIREQVKLAWQTSGISNRRLAELMGVIEARITVIKRAVFGKGGNINIDTADRLMQIFENEKGGKNVKV